MRYDTAILLHRREQAAELPRVHALQVLAIRQRKQPVVFLAAVAVQQYSKTEPDVLQQ